MSDANAALINKFYTAFAAGDAETMAACYADDAQFSDPVFTDLRGEQVRDMWRMLISRADGNLKVEHNQVAADDSTGKAHWEAFYPFGKGKRPVHNKIDAEFTFRDGKILTHRDDFNFYKWTRMALGFSGTLLGWTPLVKNKVRSTSEGMLKKYQAEQGR